MKILSIDGGGIKGLFGAAFLAGLEDRFERQVSDCFDLIAGTSTGGILALALAARIPAKGSSPFIGNGDHSFSPHGSPPIVF